MDQLDELRVFVAILDAGSLRAAARRLHRSPPSVTRSLAAIEERVGVRLVQRTTRHLAATEAGSRLADRARQLLTDYAAVVGEAGDANEATLRGRLRVTAPTLFGRRHILPIVGSFLDMHPAVRVEIVLTDRNLDLIDDGVDVAIRFGKMAESRLIARRVGEARRVLVASPDYIARMGNPRRPTDLHRHEIIYCSALSAPLEWRFRKGGRDQAVRLTPRLTVNDIEGAVLAVKAGRGIGRHLTYQVFDELRSGALVQVLSKFDSPTFPVQLVFASARHLALHARAFLDHAAHHLSALPVLDR